MPVEFFVEETSSEEDRFDRWLSGLGVTTTGLLSAANDSSLTVDGVERCGQVAEVR